jgi:hypothetical protein
MRLSRSHSRPNTSHKIWQHQESNAGTSGSVARNSDHETTEASSAMNFSAVYSIAIHFIKWVIMVCAREQCLKMLLSYIKSSIKVYPLIAFSIILSRKLWPLIMASRSCCPSWWSAIVSVQFFLLAAFVRITCLQDNPPGIHHANRGLCVGPWSSTLFRFGRLTCKEISLEAWSFLKAAGKG